MTVAQGLTLLLSNRLICVRIPVITRCFLSSILPLFICNTNIYTFLNSSLDHYTVLSLKMSKIDFTSPVKSRPWNTTLRTCIRTPKIILCLILQWVDNLSLTRTMNVSSGISTLNCQMTGDYCHYNYYHCCYHRLWENTLRGVPSACKRFIN